MIWHHRIIMEKSAANIWLSVFQNDVNKISFRYLKELCTACDSGLQNERFNGARARRTGGPHFMITDLAQESLLDIFRETKQVRLEIARQRFLADYYGLAVGGPSVRTIGRTLYRGNFTRKVMQRVHYLRDPIKRATYMGNAAPFHFSLLVDIDETLSTWKEFLQRYGYAPVGEEAIRTQFRINGRHYSSVCAYSPIGLIAYRAVEGSIDADIFQSFLQNEVAAALVPGMVGLFDNAAIHHTPVVRNVMENVFNGLYLFAAPYSPDLEPVQRLFAEIKDLVRYREADAVIDPVGVISECFDLFRPGGPKSGMAVNHFRIYRDNHNMWLLRMNL